MAEINLLKGCDYDSVDQRGFLKNKDFTKGCILPSMKSNNCGL